jgi:hypothetical protein
MMAGQKVQDLQPVHLGHSYIDENDICLPHILEVHGFGAIARESFILVSSCATIE